MRKLFNFFAAALVMLAAASCEKNEVLPDNNSEGKIVTLKASINNGGTKTSLGAGVWEEGDPKVYPVLWSEGDAIAVIQGSKVYKFTLKDGAGKTSATFQSESAEGFDPSSKATIACYPYTTQLNFYVVQTNQNYAEKSFDSDAILMEAFMEEGSLKFNNILGILKLTIKGASDETVSSIELTANKPISGNAQFNDKGEGPFIVTEGPYADYKNNIVLNCPDVEIATAKEFLITVPAGTYDFAVTINTNKGTYYKSTTNKEILNNVILKMPALDLTDFENSMSYVENGVYLGEGIALPAGEGKTIIWAPVNCGYDENHRYGLLYQWGRKYGQGYDGETPAAEKKNEKLTSADAGSDEVNKNNFYCVAYNPGGDYNWLNPAVDNLWYNNVSGATSNKTQYDPCPAGWRVPTSAEMKSLSSGFLTSNYPGASEKNTEKFEVERGYYFYGVTDEASAVNKVFFPAAGELLPDGECGKWMEYDGDGAPIAERNNRGYIGYYWTSTANNTDSYFLMLGKAYEDEVWNHKLIINNSSRRATGMSVRCVKDMTQSQSMPVSN